MKCVGSGTVRTVNVPLQGRMLAPEIDAEPLTASPWAEAVVTVAIPVASHTMLVACRVPPTYMRADAAPVVPLAMVTVNCVAVGTVAITYEVL